jgi:predicted protein tyrosine phosphatase
MNGKKYKRILFICQCNVNRSPTFASVVRKTYPELEVKDAGVWFSENYGKPIDEGLVAWADVVYAMDWEQKMALAERFPQYDEKVKIIGISDQYDRDEPRLVEIIQYWMKYAKKDWDVK